MAVFADLPAELRLQIWELSVVAVEPAVFMWGAGSRALDPVDCENVPFPRVRKRRYPLVTNTCRESRAHLLSRPLATRYHIGQAYRPLDPDLDVVFLRWPAQLNRMSTVINLAIGYGNRYPWPAQVRHLALSHECAAADLWNHDVPGAQPARTALFQTLMCNRSPGCTMKSVSLVCVASDVDLDVPDPWVGLADWSPAKTTVQERETVLALRAVLAKEMETAERSCMWRPHSFFPPIPGSGQDDARTVVDVKRMVRPGFVPESRRWKGNAWIARVAALARWWATTRHSQVSM